MADHYILDGKKVVPTDLMSWARWFEKSGSDRVIASTNVGQVRVSTVFLGLDHQFGNGPPLLFETMVFDAPDSFNDIYCERCSTYDEAEKMHKDAIKWARNNEPHN